MDDEIIKNDNYLGKIFYYRNLTNEWYSKFESALFEFEDEFEIEDFYIEPNSDVYHGRISVETNDSLIEEWFEKYHEAFIYHFNLKLIRVTKNVSLGYEHVLYKLDYTYRSNNRVPELTLDKINGGEFLK